MKLDHLAVKTSDIERLKTQYESLGLHFDKHDSTARGEHYKTDFDGFIFEIYSLPTGEKQNDCAICMGFEVEALDATIAAIKQQQNLQILTPPAQSTSGYVALVADLDGRKIELRQKRNSL